MTRVGPSATRATWGDRPTKKTNDPAQPAGVDSPSQEEPLMTVAIDRRSFLVSVPALLAAHRLMAQGGAPQIRVNGLSQMTLPVSDPKRSIDFYQGLFGMPVQARQGTTTYLRIGAGPRFLAIVPAAAGEKPSISRFGMGVEQFNVDNVLKILAQHGVTPEDPANAASRSVAPMKVRVVKR